jgi:alcohol dehydrogenase
MHAVVFHGPGQKHWEEVPDPKIVDDSDAIVRITSTTICAPTCTSSKATSRR